MSNTTHREPIAVVGVAALFPGSLDKSGFWADILGAVDCLSEVPASHWLVEDYYHPDPREPDKTYCRRGGFLSPVRFDPVRFGIPPASLENVDTAQLLALHVAATVLDEVTQGQSSDVDRSRVSVILGVAQATELVGQLASRIHHPLWAQGMRDVGLSEAQIEAACRRIAEYHVPWTEAAFPGLLGNVVAGRIANRLDLGGANFVTDAACASSLSAVSMAVNELHLGHADLVITGGVDALNDIVGYMCFSKTPALSASGDCRPFSDAADGTIIGEGIGLFALKRLADAEGDGNPIYGVIWGVGASSDGQATSIYGPRAQGQALALRRAYEQAGYDPQTVELIEAHGTATRAGDKTEFAGLCEVFDGARSGGPWCALGSVKSQVGHTKAAAGAAGLFKALMAVHHKVLPPTAKVERPNQLLEFDASPFYINTQARPWVAPDDHPRRASVSSFGFGGSNFHLTLEEYRGPGKRPARLLPPGEALILLHAESRSGLSARCVALRDEFSSKNGPTNLAAYAVRTQLDFDAGMPWRCAIVAAEAAELVAKLERTVAALENGGDANASQGASFSVALAGTGPGVWVGTPDNACVQRQAGDRLRKAVPVGYLFPGQGSQYVGMGAALASTFESAREVWDAMALSGPEGREIVNTVFPPPTFEPSQRTTREAHLTSLERAQPAIGAVSRALLGVVDRLGLCPVAAAGHSYGEISALHAAGVIDDRTADALSRERGQLMRLSGNGEPGAMLAVSADRARIEALVNEWDADIVMANDNSPAQVVLSGSEPAIDAAERRLGALGIGARRLSVATAFHSSFVAGAQAPFREYLERMELRAPSIPVFANATGERYPDTAAGISSLLARQLTESVQFRSCVEAMYEAGIRVFLEIGPGRVLTGLVGECLKGRDHLALSLDGRSATGLRVFWEGLAQLCALGVPLDFEALWSEFQIPQEKQDDDSPHTILVGGANLGKRYPVTDENRLPPVPAVSDSNLADVVGGAQPSKLPAAAASTEPAFASEQSATPAPTASPSIPAAQLMELFATYQRETAATHEAVQKSMADSHFAYLQMSERVLGALIGSPAGTELKSESGHATREPTASLAASAMSAAVSPSVPEPQEIAGRPRIIEPPMPAAPATPTAEAALPASTTSDVYAALLRIVAEKTGYPLEALGPGMEIESDLGIDSIKQVEILAAVSEALPSLRQLDPTELANLRTLEALANALLDGGAGPAAADADAAPAAATDEEPGRGEVAASDAGVSLHTSLVRHRPTLECAPAPDLRVDTLAAASSIAVTPAGPFARALATALDAAGYPVAIDDVASVSADAVIFVGALQAQPTAAASTACHLAGLRAARALLGRSAADGPHGDAVAPTFVSVQDTGGCFGLRGDSGSSAWLAGLPGLVKTIGRERPDATVKAIDIERGSRSIETIAEALVAELTAGGPEIEVGLGADGTRRTVVLEPLSCRSNGSASLGPEDVLLVTGGARGITRYTLAHLARAASPRIAILGRTRLEPEPEHLRNLHDEAGLVRALLQPADASLPVDSLGQARREAARVLASREVRDGLAELQACGSEILYLTCDVRERNAVEAAASEVRRRFGPITGLIHAAGVVADRRIADKTDAEFSEVFEPKVLGLSNLIEATATDPLRYLCVYSSAVARFGNAGQADYAMANEVLNKVALAEAARRHPGCLVRAIGWGPWEGGMVDAALQRHFEQAGIPLIPLEPGARHLLQELCAATDEVEVIVGVGNGLGHGKLSAFTSPEPPAEVM